MSASGDIALIRDCAYELAELAMNEGAASKKDVAFECDQIAAALARLEQRVDAGIGERPSVYDLLPTQEHRDEWAALQNIRISVELLLLAEGNGGDVPMRRRYLDDSLDEYQQAREKRLATSTTLVVDAGEPGGVRQKPDVVEAGDCACDGSGKIVDHFTGDPNHWVDISNGLQMGAPSGYSSRLCSCRKSLPKRDGEATWWGSSEPVFEEIVEFALFDESATVSVGVETCISEDNYLVHRTKENAYYPCQISLEVSDTNLSWLMPDDLRSLAAALLRAADKCDEIDGPLASTTPPEAAPVPGSPDLASQDGECPGCEVCELASELLDERALADSLTRERDDARAQEAGLRKHLDVQYDACNRSEAQVAVYRQALERAEEAMWRLDLISRNEYDSDELAFSAVKHAGFLIRTEMHRALAAVVVGQQPDEQNLGGRSAPVEAEVSESEANAQASNAKPVPAQNRAPSDLAPSDSLTSTIDGLGPSPDLASLGLSREDACQVLGWGDFRQCSGAQIQAFAVLAGRLGLTHLGQPPVDIEVNP